MDKQLLFDLCALDGPSGKEDAVRAYILTALEQLKTPMEVQTDAMGNVIVHLIGREKPRHKVQFDAHMDEVGFIITHVEDSGFLRFSTVGGIDKQVLFGHRVRFGDQIGIIGGKAIHQCDGDEKEKIPDAETMLIDIGADGKDAVPAGIKPGAYGTFDSELREWDNGFFMGKAVDDRVGCALLLTLAAKQPKYDIWLTFSVQEEIGLRGAGVAAETVRPEYAVAIDATTAADTAGSTPATSVCHVGEGAVVSFADRATLYDAELYRNIRHMAEEKSIPTQTKNKVAGGNNAGAIQQVGNGVHMTAVSLPCRYIHSPACVGNWSDVQAMEDLLFALAEKLPEGFEA